MKRLMCFILLLIANIITSTAFAAIPVDGSLAPMLKQILPSIVNIKAQIKVTDFSALQEIMKRRQSNGGDASSQKMPITFVSVGSGVIVDVKNGYILTNAHVVNDAQMIAVTLGDGRHFTAKLIGLDKPSDVALLQIKGKNLTAIAVRDSNKVNVGDFVAAIGNSYGLSQTVTSGIVSAVGRNTLGIESYENFIQTDASINPGNSGGALIDMNGRLVGINTAILAPSQGSVGIGFAIPSNMAMSVMQQLIQFGNVKRGLLGIGAQDLTPELANAFNEAEVKGAAVTLVQPESPAQHAGIEVGDIITYINNIDIKNASDVVNTIGFLRVDSKVKIDLLRNNKKLSVNLSLTDPQKRKEAVEQLDPFLYGVGLKNFSLLSPVHGAVQGVLIVSLEEDSLSWQSDLRPGDVITSVNQQKIKNIEELKAITKKASKTLLLNVLRGQVPFS